MSETILIEPQHEHAGKLGRSIITLDERSLQYPARGVLFQEDLPPKTKTWRRPTAWDQALTSQCVIYTGKGQINTEPFRTAENYAKRKTFNYDYMYRLAQTIDEWPGEAPVYEGTSVLAGQKALKIEGFIQEYRWCFGLSDVLKTLSYYGAVGIGVTWYNSMFYPVNEYGLLNVDVNSGIAGGHAVELHGLNISGKYVIGTNSWGTGWGNNGRFRIKWTDLDMLLKDYGEAYTIVS